MSYLFDFLIFFFGAVIGSFLNVVILRLPEDKPLGGRSHCLACGHKLGPAELVPMLSYLALRGKCKKCKAQISPRYFIIEAATGLLFLIGWLVLIPSGIIGYVLYLKFILLSAVGLVIFTIDLEHYIIVSNLVFGSAIVALLLNLFVDVAGHHVILSWHSYVVRSVLSGILGAAPIFLTWAFPPRGQWMGFGDVELMLFLGAVVGFPQVFVALFVAVIGGGVVSVILLSITKKTLKSRVPFGTFLVPGSVLAMLWGPWLLHWYLSLLGF